jgi:hypothetical protein
MKIFFLLSSLMMCLCACKELNYVTVTYNALDNSLLKQVPSLSYSASTGTSGIVGIAMNVTPSEFAENSSPLSHCSSTPSLPSGLSIDSSSCVITGTPSVVFDPTSYTITATNAFGSTSATVTLSSSCPVGFAPVDADPLLGVDLFCIMKYEARCATSLDGTTACPLTEGAPDATKIAVAIPEGKPWNKIEAQDAVLACQNLNGLYSVSNKFDLISNTEWIATARNIEQETSNWTDDAGVLKINRGHSDNSPVTYCDSTLPNVDTDCSTSGTDFFQKRTHTLLSSHEIWDFAGNMHEWTDWIVEAPSNIFTVGPQNCPLNLREVQAKITECDPDLGSPLPSVSNIASPLDVSLDSSRGIGRIYGTDTLGSKGAAHRGGDYRDTVISGIYMLSLNVVQTTKAGNLGFRCVYRP